MSEKIVGYTLLGVGLVIMGLSALDVYRIFTKQKQPIQLFNFEGIEIDPAQYVPQFEIPENFIRREPRESQKVEILPAGMINESANIFAHLFLMGFIVNIGAKIATLGTTLARTIEVKVNTKHTSNSLPTV